MAADFPVPRTELPTVRVSPEEYTQRKQQVSQLLQHTLLAFEEHTERNRRQPEPRRWKQDSSKDRLKLFKERNPSPSSSSDKRAWMLVGETSGRVEDALYAFSCESHVEQALLSQFLYEDVADCAVLKALENARDDDPYRSLAYKWFAKQSSSGKNNRDAVYVEYSGTTATKGGKEIGYHILQSVELSGFPDLRSRSCVRSSRDQSIRTLFCQSTDNTVEVFMLANIDAAASRGLLRSSSSSSGSLFTQDTLYAIANGAITCGETKRLTMLIQECRQIRASEMRQPSVYAYHEEAVLCSMCRQEKKKFNSITLHDCEVCGTTICNKCRENRRIFAYDRGGQMGRFEKVTCCQTCAFNAKRIRPEAPAWANKRESSTASDSSITATRLQLRSGSVASTVASEGTSMDATGVSMSLPTSSFAGESDDDYLSARASQMMARLSLGSEDLNSRVSVDSVDCIDYNDDHKSAMLVQSNSQRGHGPSGAPPPSQTGAAYGMTPQAAYQHQMQLYMRMQQLTQLAEQTYHTAKQQGQPSSTCDRHHS